MAEKTAIAWTDYTFNPWRGCTKVSPGCAHCYADTMSKRNPGTLGQWGPNGTRVVAAESYWRLPLKWNQYAVDPVASAMRTDFPRRPRVFCASLADVFEDWGGPITTTDGGRLFINPDGEWMTIDRDAVRTPSGSRFATLDDVRRRLFSLIDATPNLDWLLLTKRPENILRMWPRSEYTEGRIAPIDKPWRNVWLGVSVEDQKRADERIPELLKCRDLASVLFLSCEPLLGPVDLSRWVALGECGSADGMCLDNSCRTKGIDWVIVGGESGPGYRPMEHAWAIGLRDQCKAAGVSFFFKQSSAPRTEMGIELDGQIVREFPVPRQVEAFV